MDEDRLIELLLGYFERQLSSEESEELNSWVSASAEHRKYFSDMYEVWTAVRAESAAGEFDADKAYRRFRQRARQYARRNKPRSRFVFLGQLAAAAAVLALVVFFSYRRGEKQVRDAFADIVIEAPLSSQSRIVLPDSTEVWMNAGSRLVYSQGFGLTDRRLKMSGECFFSVMKNPEMPFVVSTPTLQVRVLGTRFNFRSYPDDDEAVIALEEGSVSLKNMVREETERILSPNQKAILNNRTGHLRIERTQADNHSSWVQGHLFFNDELLVDIVKELRRNYDVEIEIRSEALLGQRFYGGFDRKDLSIDEILDRFSATGNIHYRKEGSKIVLY
ncbi:MAG: DUF4974 domain-containing protein [Bacteroidales bacterium]|nr:DUF4974 domain-containing protein [Bacteroidales bacterium]